MSDKRVEPLFQEYLKHKHPIQLPDQELLKAEREFFYVGMWAGLGLIKRTDNMSEEIAVKFIREVSEEVKQEIYHLDKDAKQTRIITRGGAQ